MPEPFSCSPGDDQQDQTDFIAIDVVEAMGPNTPEEAMLFANLFSSSTQASADIRKYQIAETQVVDDVTEPSGRPKARVVVDRFYDTWVVTSASFCLPPLPTYDEDE